MAKQFYNPEGGAQQGIGVLYSYGDSINWAGDVENAAAAASDITVSVVFLGPDGSAKETIAVSFNVGTSADATRVAEIMYEAWLLQHPAACRPILVGRSIRFDLDRRVAIDQMFVQTAATEKEIPFGYTGKIPVIGNLTVYRS